MEKTVLVDEAIDELRGGNVERHNTLVAARAHDFFGHPDSTAWTSS